MSDESKEPADKKRPSLTHIIISLKTHSKQQEALGHILTALQIAYARDTIVNALSGIVRSHIKDEDAEQSSSLELTVGLPIASLVPKQGVIHEKQEVSSLDEYTTLLTVEDARVLVDLLKLAVSGRVGKKGKDTLGMVVTAMGKANSEVSLMVIQVNIQAYIVSIFYNYYG